MPQHDIEHEVNATLIKEQTMNQQQQQIEACEACMQMVGTFSAPCRHQRRGAR